MSARGVTAVISPWNFPLAIPVRDDQPPRWPRETAVVLKPAEQSPACALRLVQALRAGRRSPIGDLTAARARAMSGPALVRHPRRADDRLHRLTGRGDRDHARAAEIKPGQLHIKRVIAELGGKNCVIVDADADLDDAVPAIVSSAFIYAGQKCSAAARVLVHEAIADRLIERVAGAATRALVGGPGRRPGTEVPPVIERARAGARRALRRAGPRGRGRSSPRWSGSRPRAGSARPPCLADLPAGLGGAHARRSSGRCWRSTGWRDIEEACEIVDRLPVALTGGLFARDPATIRYVRRRSPVGNLYINRGITGRQGGPPALWRQPALRERHQGRRPGLSAAFRGTPGRDREHRPSRAGRVGISPAGSVRNLPRRRKST